LPASEPILTLQADRRGGCHIKNGGNRLEQVLPKPDEQDSCAIGSD